MFVFSPQYSCTKKMNLWSLLCHNIFIQGAGWIKYWFVTPFALPCFFCFPAFSFWWIITVPKGKYILVAQFPSVYCCWYFPFIFPLLLDAVLCILHPRVSPTTMGYNKNRERKIDMYLRLLCCGVVFFNAFEFIVGLFSLFVCPSHLLVHEEAQTIIIFSKTTVF